jgi:GGDEF domain-containing protein
MLITSASYSPFTSVATRRFIEQELQRDLERERRRRERRLEEQRLAEAAADRDEGGTMEW